MRAGSREEKETCLDPGDLTEDRDHPAMEWLRLYAYGDRLAAYLASHAGVEQEDLRQEILLCLVRKLGRVKVPHPFGFLKESAPKVLANLLRDQRLWKQVDLDVGLDRFQGAATGPGESEIEVLVGDAPPDVQSFLRDILTPGRSRRTIAGERGVSQPTLSRLAKRALHWLGEGDLDGTPGGVRKKRGHRDT
jgi:DNA-directed RNA polymerase specialized sigma24 family protein